MKMRRHLSLFLLSLSVLLVVRGEAQEKQRPRGNAFAFSSSRAPIDITSDSVEANQKENTVTFKGNVVAKQEDTTLYAQILTIRYEGETRRLKEIIATGDVKIVQGDRRATGRKATFQQEEDKVILEGEAVLREGENEIRGERVIFYVGEERSIVEGGKGTRVQTHIKPPPKEK